MSEMKSLAKETAIYGGTTIVGKFMNYLLVPLYTYVLEQSSDYGIVTNLYAWTALLLVLLTYGMETGFFRFVNNEEFDPKKVYSTALICLFSTSFLFGAACVLLQGPIATLLGYPEHSEFISLLGVTVAIDAFACIPFAYLRYKKRPIRFAAAKLLFVFLNILFNIFFLVLCPKIQDWSIINCWYDANYGVGYVFIANILATGIQTLFLLPTIFAARGGGFSGKLLGKMLLYSLPLLILGVAGIMNQTLDRIIFPYLYSGSEIEAQEQLGIYGACFKVAMVMMIFTQAFRYAYEPFVFAKHKDKQSVSAYADAMKYYILFSFLIVLGMIVYLDLLKYIIAPTYWEGLRIVPIVLWAYVFQGIYFNLSFWYKLTDKTYFGAIFSLLGLAITAGLQVMFVPQISYFASAGSNLVCYFIIMLISYFVGRKFLDIPYEYKRIGGYTLLIFALLGCYYGFEWGSSMLGSELLWGTADGYKFIQSCQPFIWMKMLFGTILVGIYCAVLVKKDFPLSGLPVVGKYFRK